MVDLSPSEFSIFFEAVHGHPPFPWQARLLEQVVDSGKWPELLDLPTGTGKTAALDVAVFHLALEAERHPRRAALRTLFVVDRRTIVDQAFRRAQKLARALADSAVDIVKRVASRLASLSREGEPLTVVALRGGMPRSDVWARSPERPVIAISTVDQVGSRLLFRGYGLSDAMKPIHAGLLGQDTLWLLDEVHLSEPFRQTLTAVSSRYRKWADVSLPAPFSVVEMSGTPGRVEDRTRFGLESDDKADAVLARRLSASKPVELVGDVKERAFADTCVKKTTALLQDGHLTVGVVVNRVQVARDVASHMAKSLGAKADVRLITGRMRPLDRDDIEQELTPRIGAGRDRSAFATPLVVVATQCIEAGADFDFDALVTECASLDALRQRFGRLNRLGEIEDARGVILIRSGRLESDPVYGDAIAATASWLTSLDSVDFGLSRLSLPPLAQMRPMLASSLDAPVLLPAHLDAWSQTAPIPEPDPDVALWLHGPDRGSPEVQVVWRADLSLAQLEAAAEGDATAIEAMTTGLEALPPSSPEAMSLPLHEVRRWLLGLASPDSADVEGATEVEVDSRGTSTREWRLVAWRGYETRVVGPGDLRPGDTLIAPTEYGGITNGNWAPDSTSATDRAEEASARQRGRVTLRLFRDSLGGVTPELPVPSDDLDDRMAVRDWLEAASGGPEWAGPLITRLRDETRRSLPSLPT